MPTTYTDDIAPVLPSAIDGPFKIVDPSDSAASITIDPATSKISVAGDARSVRMLSPAFVNSWGTTSFGVIGIIACRSVATGVNGGFYAAPIRIRPDVDVGEPITLRILLETGATGPPTASVVRFKLRYGTVGVGGGTPSDTTLTFDWSPPLNWATSDTQVIVIDNGNGWTFDAGTFTNLEYVGFRLARYGADAGDTFPQTIKIASAIAFEYTAKQY